MANILYKTKGNVNPQGKPRVYFTCHPEDFDKYFNKVCEDILKTHDCVIYYKENMSETIFEEDITIDIGRSNMIVIPVTLKLLTSSSPALNQDLTYALREHIPILPIMMDSEIDEIYSEHDKFGELQYLNPFSTDLTEISYYEKLKKYLDSVLISDEMASRIRAAFDAYIFLSYRKKDRCYANELMHIIHSKPECRNIAIWFDEFLTPGESFKDSIKKILDNCNLFTLLVTPRLLEKVVDKNGKERDNYVISTELPLAQKNKEEKGIDILAVEMEDTQKEALATININDYVNVNDKNFSSRLLETVSKIAVSPTDTAEHNFLIGLAYLDGIDVEVNRKRAIELITDAAEKRLDEAMLKLIYMYTDGIGVAKNRDKGLEWSEKLSNCYFERIFSEDGIIKSEKEIRKLFSHYSNEYWTHVIKFFLVNADKSLPLETVKKLYEILMNLDISEYTLFFDACREMSNYQERTQIILIGDILTKSVCGTYPPYGPLFWYIPQYELYEVSFLVLNKLKSSAFFAKMLVLIRDVCFIVGRKYIASEITNRVNPAELYNTASLELKGVRKALCELFYTGNTKFTGKSNIYPRCFNVEDSKSITFNGLSLCKKMRTPFKDEMGLYSHTSYNELQNEYIGLISCPYDIDKIEKTLSAKPCRKLCGMILFPTFDTKMRYMSINRNHISVIYIPENINELSGGYMSWDEGMPLSLSILRQKNCVIYVGEHIMLPEGTEKIEDNMFYKCEKIKDIAVPSTVKMIGNSAFEGCTSLLSISIPDSVTEVKRRAFAECDSLISVHLGKGITKINEEVFSACRFLTNINIPEGVKEIGENAFKRCKSLTSVNIPEGLEIINKSAFFGCVSLVSINLPKSIKKIGSGAFAVCSSLDSVNIPEGIKEIEYGTFESCSSLKTISFPESLVSINLRAFFECTSLTTLILPNGITKIDMGAFDGCSSLKSIHLPETLEIIRFNAFARCTALTSVVIPERVEMIEHESFIECSSLKSVTFPEGLKLIGNNAFAGCKNLSDVSIAVSTLVKLDSFDNKVLINRYDVKSKNFLKKLSVPYGTTEIKKSEYCGQCQLLSVDIPDTVTVIGKAAFMECNNLKLVVIPDSVRKIEYSAFAGCIFLDTVKLPKRIKKIESHLFCECRALTSINIPDGVKIIESDAFRGCSSLTTISIPESVDTIEHNVFERCSSLKSVNIPDGIKIIADGTFRGCSDLTTINIPESVNQIDSSAFSNCISLVSVNLPEGIKMISSGMFFYCTSLSSIKIPDSVTEICGNSFSYCRNLKSINIPEGVKEIEYEAFCGCSSLSSVELPENISKIGCHAFSQCTGLNSINIPDGIKEIADYTFHECTSLSSIKIPESVTHIGSGAFCGCKNLKSINIPRGITKIPYEAFSGCIRMNSVEIPETVKKIWVEAFLNCQNLETIIIPEGVEEIGEKAFMGCTNLKSVSISNSVRIIKPNAFSDCKALSSVIINQRFEDDIPHIFGDIDSKIITFTN